MDRRHFMTCAASSLMIAAAPPPAARSEAADELHVLEYNKRRRFARLPQGNVAYVEAGAGCAVLFLHGFPLNGFQWRHAIERLAPYRRCIAPDFLAMGHTQVAPGQGVGPQDQAEMIVSLLDALGVRQADIIANDSGGAVAQLIAARYGDRVRSLLLTNCDSAIESPPAALAPVLELSRRGEFADGWLGKWHKDPTLARSPQGIGGMCYSDPANPTDAAIDFYFAPLLASPGRKALVHQYALALERNPLEPAEPELRRSKVPVRIVWGEADAIFSVDGARHIDRTFPNSKGLRLIPGRKLFWPEEDSGLIAEEALGLWGT
ncbi:MAG TPA: alpha/beta hydrolase [Sphingomicrobium sp.]